MNQKNILVIDDEFHIRELVKDFLEIEHITCDGAGNLKEALALLVQKDYHLILLDRNLEDTRAEDIIGEILNARPQIPVVLLTGDQMIDDKYLLKIGAAGAIFKPFQYVEFIAMVKKYLEI